MYKKIITFLFTCLIGFACLGDSLFSPTNIFYKAGENVVEFAPTLSSPSLFSYKAPVTYGYSFEYEHWTSVYAGTGIEFGNYDYKVTTYGIIDHLAIMEDFRYIPWPQNPVFNRFALGWKTGAETFFVDGSKDIEFGGEFYWSLAPNIRLEGDILDHIRTKSSEDGQTVRVAIQWKF